MKKTDFIFIAVATLLVFTIIFSVNKIPTNNSSAQPKTHDRAIYFWRTTLSLNDGEIDFLKKHKINKMFVRFFDVDVNKNPKFSDKCAPVASIEFYNTEVKNYVEIVPVIFITPDAIKDYHSFTNNLAHRVYAMCSKNKITINEVQFDCDWTTSTKKYFFNFINDVRPILNDYFGKNIKISSTIRLHQLMQDAPNVDYGVLMCYNTGDFKNFDTKNSILDVKDVKPYINQYLKKYNLSLTLALPTYSWGIEFDKNRDFVKLNGEKYSVNDTKKYKHLYDNCYEVINQLSENDTKYVRYEQVPAETILEVKKMINKQRKGMPIALYHLDINQLSKYSNDEIKAFYN